MLSTFFVDHLDGKLALFQNLQSLSQSYAGPHFIWESPLPDWMSLFMKLLKSILIFEHKLWRIKSFFRRPPRRKIISVSKPTGIITVLRRSSTQLKKSFTRLNITFHETVQEYFKFELKIWQVHYFFRRPPRRKIISVSKPTGIITVLRRPSIQLKKSFTRLKIAFQETAQEDFLSSVFGNVLSIFFLDHLDGKLAMFHNLLGLSISLVDPHFIWESPSLDWISLFMKLRKSIFWAQNLTC